MVISNSMKNHPPPRSGSMFEDVHRQDWSGVGKKVSQLTHDKKPLNIQKSFRLFGQNNNKIIIIHVVFCGHFSILFYKLGLLLSCNLMRPFETSALITIQTVCQVQWKNNNNTCSFLWSFFHFILQIRPIAELQFNATLRNRSIGNYPNSLPSAMNAIIRTTIGQSKCRVAMSTNWWPDTPSCWPKHKNHSNFYWLTF